LITFIIGTGSVRRVAVSEMAEQRDAGVRRGSLRGRERDAEDRVRAEPPLVRRPVELDQRAVEPLLIHDITSTNRVGDLAR
jgi:hypothetical protein